MNPISIINVVRMACPMSMSKPPISQDPPQSSIHTCLGPDCMAWQWTKPPVLERMAIIDRHEAEKDGILRLARITNPPDECTDEEWHEFREKFGALEIAPQDFSGLQDFEPAGEPIYNPGESEWAMPVSRKYDPTAQGVCGMVNHINAGASRCNHGA